MIPLCILLFLVFFLLQTLVLFCCLAAGNDPLSQELSDLEQMEYIVQWKKLHRQS